MTYSDFDHLVMDEPTVIVPAASIDKSLVSEMIEAAFIKATDAATTNISAATRIDAAYDAMMMFAMALFASKGFYASSSAEDDRLTFEGVAHLLGLPKDTYTGMLALSGWPRRKYAERLKISRFFLEQALQSVRSIILHVNIWMKQSNT